MSRSRRWSGCGIVYISDLRVQRAHAEKCDECNCEKQAGEAKGHGSSETVAGK